MSELLLLNGVEVGMEIGGLVVGVTGTELSEVGCDGELRGEDGSVVLGVVPDEEEEELPPPPPP